MSWKVAIIPAPPGFFAVGFTIGADGPSALDEMPVVAWAIGYATDDGDGHLKYTTSAKPITTENSARH